MARTDLVDIELNAKGIARAGAGGTLTMNGSRKSYTFKPGASQEVDVAYTWRRWLSRTGLFQVVATLASATGANASAGPVASTAAPAAQTAKPAAATEPHRFTPAEAVAAAEKHQHDSQPEGSK